MQSRSKTGLACGLVARLHAVAGQAEDVAHAHRGAAEHVALDGDAVAVAAGDLHDRRIARRGSAARRCRPTRHVAVGAGGVGGVDGIDPAVERPWRGRRRPPGRRESGGLSSVVTANSPARSTRSSRPREVWPGSGGERRDRMPAGFSSRWREPAARSGALGLAVRARRLGLRARPAARRNGPAAGWSTGFCTSRMASPLAYGCAPSQALHPDAGHLGLDLAIAVVAHAAAGAVAQVLRAVHRAGHAGRGQDALAAHPAVEQEALDHPLDGGDGLLQPLIADALQHRGQHTRLDSSML